MNTHTKILKVLIVILLLGFCHEVSASTAVVQVDTAANQVNALEGTLLVPNNVKIDKILTGNSAISFWVELPKNLNNKISFSGITPGAFVGKRNIFILEGSWTEKDLSNFKFNNVHALLNDGKGTEVKVSMKVITSELQDDTTIPEAFIPVVSTSTEIFNGNPFLVFAAQDKGTGVSHYELAFTYLFPPSEKDWRVVESPFLLTNSDLHKKIYIKAVDNAGNERIVIFKPDAYTLWFRIGILLAMLILVSIIAVLRKLWVKPSSQPSSY
ncbi:hypothetical protein KW790_01950 [Candidatus Parcubacteria bacterium]|nr:hypothetical protein [Candidatus Parcubacteria bacterium]